jgi:acyl-CoA synthetase (AMP-forming)/AMP-acid ligase II
MARALEIADPKAFVGIPKAHLLSLRFRSVAQIPLRVVVGPPQVARLLGAHSLEAVEERGRGARVRRFEGDENAPMLLTFSSGTGGTPKGAVRSVAFLRAQHEAIDALVERRPERSDVELSAFAIVMVSTLSAGATAVLPPTGRRGVHDIDGEEVARLVRDRRVTVISGSPTFLAPLFRAAKRAPLACVRRVLSGGAPVPLSLCDDAEGVLPDGSFLVVYGSTEAEPIATIDAREVREETAAGTRQGRGLCVGRTAPHLALRLVRFHPGPLAVGPEGLDGLCVAPGDVGEIVVTGPHVNKRYFRDRDAERATKIVDERGEIWHRTGDAGSLDAQGRLWFAGRVSDAVRRGTRIHHPAAVEALAQGDPAVARAALLAGAHDELLLVVEPVHDAGACIDPRALQERLATHGVPVDRVVTMRELPTDPRHRAKLDYKALRRRLG